LSGCYALYSPLLLIFAGASPINFATTTTPSDLVEAVLDELHRPFKTM